VLGCAGVLQQHACFTVACYVALAQADQDGGKAWYGVADSMCVLLQIGIAVMHLGRLYLDSGWLSVLVAFQCVMLWFRLNYFSR
jgi:hypothetical protein